MKRKAIVISIALLLTVLFSVPSFAAAVCKIGSKEYSSLQEAVEQVGEGQTIKVTKKIKTSDMVVVTENTKAKHFTIDFKNKKYSYSGFDVAFEICGNIELTIKNLNLVCSRESFLLTGSENGVPLMIINNGKIQGSGPLFEINKDCAVVIKNGTYTNRSKVHPFAYNRGKFAMEDGTYYGFGIENDGILRIGKGTYTTEIKKNVYGRFQCIMNHDGGDVYIEKADFISPVNGPFVNFKGGNFDFAGGTVLANGPYRNMGKSALTGGTFSPYKGYKDALIINTGEMIINGAKINGKVEGVAMG